MTLDTHKFASNGEIRIAYQVVGEGPDLVLHHGFSRSGNRWKMQGYVDQLTSQFRLILIDARGHGASDKPHDSADYSLTHRVADVLAVMDAEGIDAAHHWGYSMGGTTCYALAMEHAERIKSLVIGGMHPYERDPEPLNRRIEKLQSDGVDGFTGLFEGEFGASSTDERAQFDANDPLALAAATAAIRDEEGFTDGHLSTSILPALVYCGELDLQFLDGAEWAADTMNATFVQIPDCDHMAAQNPDLVLPIVLPFLRFG
jgi:pimeloyl-ACP methyl ester carboxylesterase